MKLTQVRSYVVAVKKNKIKGTYCDIDKDGIYYVIERSLYGLNNIDPFKIGKR